MIRDVLIPILKIAAAFAVGLIAGKIAVSVMVAASSVGIPAFLTVAWLAAVVYLLYLLFTGPEGSDVPGKVGQSLARFGIKACFFFALAAYRIALRLATAADLEVSVKLRLYRGPGPDPDGDGDDEPPPSKGSTESVETGIGPAPRRCVLGIPGCNCANGGPLIKEPLTFPIALPPMPDEDLDEEEEEKVPDGYQLKLKYLDAPGGPLWPGPAKAKDSPLPFQWPGKVNDGPFSPFKFKAYEPPYAYSPAVSAYLFGPPLVPSEGEDNDAVTIGKVAEPKDDRPANPALDLL
jgi:hypothetical protein